MSPSSLPPQKKRKLTPADSKLKEIETIEATINKSLAEGGSLNCLADLLDLARSSSDAAILHKALYALYRSCVSIVASPKINLSKCLTEESKLVRAWLLERVGEYTDLLCGLMADEEKALRAAALQILMSMLKHLSAAFSAASNTPQIHSVHFRKIVVTLLSCSSSPSGGSKESGGHHKVQADLRDTFIDTWLSSYDDVRWFFFRDATALLRSYKESNPVPPQIAENLLSFLERLKTMPTEVGELNGYWIVEFGASPPKLSRNSKQQDGQPEEPIPIDEDDWRTYFDDAPPAKSATPKSNQPRVHTLSTHQCLHSLASHRAQFSACWMTLLPHIASSAPLAARALAVLHRGVMPHMDKPVRLMDWIGGCVDFGGSIGLLALNALFTLIKDYNLDFPDFYTRLYAFLTRDVMHLKHLPATILASFIKRLARLSLTAPPAAIIMIIPFVYNILKRHPALMVMIHRVDDEAELDPFDETETSPLRTNALESSLWELVSHRDHYLSSVSTLAKIFSEAFTKPSYALEDFLDHTYATLFETETKRKLKKDPAVALEPTVNLFPTNAPEEAQFEISCLTFTFPQPSPVTELLHEKQHVPGRVFLATTTALMSHPEPSKTSDEQSEAYVSNVSSSGPRNFSSIECDVRSDIQHLVWNRVSRGMGEEGATVDREVTENGIENDEPPKNASDELKTLFVEFVRCVSEENQCTSHRMRVEIKGPLAPGVTIDTPGASLFFWRFWESVVDLATMTKPHLWAAGDKMLITSHNWETLVEARKVADAKMDRAIELINVAQRIDCQEISGWKVWGKSMKWSDLPALEPIVKDFQFGLFSAISNHEDLLKPRIQRYICGAALPEPDEIKKGPVRELINLRWKWLQLQRFSAKLWNNVGRPEYFPHAIRVLDALACFTPPDTELPPMPEEIVPDDADDGTKADEPGKNTNEDAGDNSPAETVQETADDTDPVIPPLDLSFYYSLPEPFEEWSEPPIPRPPTVLQLLLAEGAAIWLSEAMPAILRYQLARPLNISEKTWFASAQETQQERDERWMKWKRGLAAVFAWCANGHSGMPGNATVLTGVARALRMMTQAEKDARRYLTKGQPSI